MLKTIKRTWQEWWVDENGTAAVEFTLVFPILMVLLIGTFDLGNGILANQKAIAAAQSVADLIARSTAVDDAMLEEAIRAGELSIEPFPLDNFGIDIVSVRFDENDQPEIVWRETRNMTGGDDTANRAVGLGQEGDGAVIVIVEYNFEPSFSVFSIGNITMQEVAFARGRRTAVVQRM